uniref:WWE domain-containing protein n=1 Tax=Neogobius melanostomus TaxID=47308 RepID=A0A8C6SAC3_9GOBI
MVGGPRRRAKKRSTTDQDSDPPLKVSLLNPSQLLLEIPPEINTSMPVWNAIKSQEVSAVWTVNPHCINVSVSPAISNQDQTQREGGNQSVTQPQGANPSRPCVMVQMLPQNNSGALSVIKVQPLQCPAPVSSYIAPLPVIITRAQPTVCSNTPETSQTQPPDVQNSTPVSELQKPLPILHFHTRSVPDVEICDNFLIRTCPDGEECVMHHTKYPFHWQFKSLSTGQWIDAPVHAQFGLEKRYCDVNQNQVYIKEGKEQYTLRFESMQLTANSKYNGIRRLVNSDRPDKNPHFPVEWIIYWWDDYKWTPYNKRTSNSLLKKMKRIKVEECSFRLLSMLYKVNFKTMKQTNVQSGFVRDIRCRPRYRSLNAMKSHLKLVLCLFVCIVCVCILFYIFISYFYQYLIMYIQDYSPGRPWF